MDLIKKAGVKDRIILKLIEDSLKAKIYEPHKITKSELGAPQGGILSPLLSNIYLHELDVYMEILTEKYKGTKEKARVNPEYSKTRKLAGVSASRKMRVPYRLPNDSAVRSVKYCRYADDFIVGVHGSRQDAEKIKMDIKDFLEKKLKIKLSEEKTKITSFAKTFTFLGYKFGRAIVTCLMKKNRNNKASYKKRTKVIYTRADVSKAIKKLHLKGFCTAEGIPTPCFRYLQLPQSIANNRINSVIIGLSE
jgi:hypothetical protein